MIHITKHGTQRYGKPMTVSRRRLNSRWGDYSTEVKPSSVAIDSLLDVQYKPTPPMPKRDIAREFAALCRYAGDELRSLFEALGDKRRAIDAWLSGGVVDKKVRMG